eukprot:182705-Chlamydomonas_euryale.AAC.5
MPSPDISAPSLPSAVVFFSLKRSFDCQQQPSNTTPAFNVQLHCLEPPSRPPFASTFLLAEGKHAIYAPGAPGGAGGPEASKQRRAPQDPGVCLNRKYRSAGRGTGGWTRQYDVSCSVTAEQQRGSRPAV